MDNAQIAHIPSSPTFASKSRFTNIVKDAIHYLKVPFPDKDRFGRPRSNSANTIASWATFRRQNAPDVTVSHSSAELSIFCAGEDIIPASNKGHLVGTLSSTNTLDSVRAALDTLSFPTPQLLSTPRQLNDRATLPLRLPGTTPLVHFQSRPVDPPPSHAQIPEYLFQPMSATGSRVHQDRICAAEDSPAVQSDLTLAHIPQSISLSSQSSKSMYSQEASRDESPPIVCSSPSKERAEGTSSVFHTSLSPLNSLALHLNGEPSPTFRSTSPKKSPIIGTPFGANDDGDVIAKFGGNSEDSGDDEPILSSQFDTVNASRVTPNSRSGDTHLQSDTALLGQLSPRSELSDAKQPPPRGTYSSHPDCLQFSTSPDQLHPRSKPKPFQDCLFLLNESELKHEPSDICDCEDCKARHATREIGRETPGHKFTRVINERHALRPKTIVEECSSLRSASGSSSGHPGTSGSTPNPLQPSTHPGRITDPNSSVLISSGHRGDEPARQQAQRYPYEALSLSKALPPLPAMNPMNTGRRPSAEDPRRHAIVNQAVLGMLFGELSNHEVPAPVTAGSTIVEPLILPRAMSNLGFLSPTNTVSEPLSPTATSYFTHQQQQALRPRSPLSSPLSSLFGLPLEPISYSLTSPGSPTERPQRKSTILGLLKKTHSMKSIRSAADSTASAPSMLALTTVHARNAEADSTKIGVPASPLNKGLLGFKREKKVPPPILVVPYQERRNELPTKTSMLEIYDDPFARIVSPPQSPSNGQPTPPGEHDGSKINLNCPISPYSPTPSSWTAVSYASSPTLTNHSPAFPQSVSSSPNVSPSFGYQSPDLVSMTKRSSHRRSSSEMDRPKSLQRFFPKSFSFIRPFYGIKDSKLAKKSALAKAVIDIEDETRSPSSPFLVKDLTLFDELTVDAVDCEVEKEISPTKKQRTARKTKRRGMVAI